MLSLYWEISCYIPCECSIYNEPVSSVQKYKEHESTDISCFFEFDESFS